MLHDSRVLVADFNSFEQVLSKQVFVLGILTCLKIVLNQQTTKRISLFLHVPSTGHI